MKKARTFTLTLFFAFSFALLGTAQSANNLPERYAEATYEGATVYAGQTDYTFKNTEGRLVRFAFSHLEENQEWNPKMPENMLASDAANAPGPNPELVGKTFFLIYAENGGMITEVRLKE